MPSKTDSDYKRKTNRRRGKKAAKTRAQADAKKVRVPAVAAVVKALETVATSSAQLNVQASESRPVVTEAKAVLGAVQKSHIEQRVARAVEAANAVLPHVSSEKKQELKRAVAEAAAEFKDMKHSVTTLVTEVRQNVGASTGSKPQVAGPRRASVKRPRAAHHRGMIQSIDYIAQQGFPKLAHGVKRLSVREMHPSKMSGLTRRRLGLRGMADHQNSPIPLLTKTTKRRIEADYPRAFQKASTPLHVWKTTVADWNRFFFGSPLHASFRVKLSRKLMSFRMYFSYLRHYLTRFPPRARYAVASMKEGLYTIPYWYVLATYYNKQRRALEQRRERRASTRKSKSASRPNKSSASASRSKSASRSRSSVSSSRSKSSSRARSSVSSSRSKSASRSRSSR